jgi:hypothetical protein
MVLISFEKQEAGQFIPGYQKNKPPRQYSCYKMAV